MTRTFGLIGLAVLALCPPAQAQTGADPSRPYRGLFGGGPPPDPARSRQELSVTVNALGGYDDMVIPGSDAAGPIQPGQTGSRGYTGTADLALRYLLGTQTKSLSVDARGFSTAYSSIAARPELGGSVNVRAHASVGRRGSLSGTQTFAYVPNLVLGSFGALQATVADGSLPDSGETSAVTRQRSRTATSNLAVEHRWTTRQTTSTASGYSTHSYLDQFGYNGTSLDAHVRHAWSFRRDASLHGEYRITHSRFERPRVEGPDFERADPGSPLTDQAVELGGSYVYRVSATRRLMFGGSAGAAHVRTLSAATRGRVDYWMPAGSGTVRVDIGRSWGVAADYRRAVNVLQGVSLQSFATDAASIRADGAVTERATAALSFGYSNGYAGVSSEVGRFVNYGSTVLLRYAIGRRWATTVTYDHYFYRLTDVALLPPSLPPQRDRNSIRAGLVFWLPLYGSYLDRGGRRSASGDSH